MNPMTQSRQDAMEGGQRAMTRASERLVVAGIEPNMATLQRNVEHSIMLATALNPHLGYDKVAQIVNKAFAEGTSPKQAAIDLGFLTAEDYDRLADPRSMLGPRP